MPDRLSFPPDLLALFERPGATWTEDEVARVIAWLLEPAQFRFLVARIRRRAPRFLTHEDAEDILMVFVEREMGRGLFRHYNPGSLGLLRPGDRFTGYLYSRIFTFVIAEATRTSKVLSREYRPGLDEPLAPAIDSPDQGIESEERRQKTIERIELAWTLITRTVKPRALFVLTEHVLRERSFHEISGELGVPTPQVRRHYWSAIRHLRTIVERRDVVAQARDWLSLLSTRAAGHLPPGAGGDHVGCTVFGPRAVGRKDRCLIQVYVHALDDDAEALRTALEFDDTASRLGAKTLDLAVTGGTRITFSLSLPGLTVDEPVQSLTWHSRTDSVTFGVEVPDDCAAGVRIGTLVAFVNSLPAGRIKFRLAVSNRQSHDGELLKPLGEEARRFTMAFISYASEDRNKVLARVQILRLLGINYFQDVLDLEPGQRWERELYRHIDECDLFLLFWSAAARASQWVLQEVRYAVQVKGGDDDAPPAIHPVIIEGPPIAPPPPELQHLHFNDRLIYFMTPDAPSA